MTRESCESNLDDVIMWQMDQGVGNGGGCFGKEVCWGWEGGELKLSSDLSHRKYSGNGKACQLERKALQQEAMKQMLGTEGKRVGLELREPWQEWW